MERKTYIRDLEIINSALFAFEIDIVGIDPFVSAIILALECWPRVCIVKNANTNFPTLNVWRKFLDSGVYGKIIVHHQYPLRLLAKYCLLKDRGRSALAL